MPLHNCRCTLLRSPHAARLLPMLSLETRTANSAKIAQADIRTLEHPYSSINGTERRYHPTEAFSRRSKASRKIPVIIGSSRTCRDRTGACHSISSNRKKKNFESTPSPPLCGTNLQYEAHGKVQTSPSSPKQKRLRKPQHEPTEPY
jgi:hypothetical protein